MLSTFRRLIRLAPAAVLSYSPQLYIAVAKKHLHSAPDLFTRPLLAAKTLTRVEVDKSSSNQHEFHAGRLRKLLGFGEEMVQGALTFLYYLDDHSQPLVEEDTYSLYDARAGKTHRGPEWHLYYHSQDFQQLARPGDLLILHRPDTEGTDLQAVVARAGTKVEQALRTALSIGDLPTIQRFIGVAPPTPADAEASELAHALIPSVVTEQPESALTAHPVYIAAIESQRIPDARTMARAAHEIVSRTHGETLGPDELLLRALETESDLFFALEAEIGERELADLMTGGAGFSSVLAFAMRKHQARRSRRGQSLQNHLELILSRAGIPFQAQCVTENGERPDFVIPGGREYHDPAYPAEKLRMVGCKSILRDRWRQYLTEAARIHPKFHVSLDESISAELLERMHNHDLRLFMPAELIEDHYSTNRNRILIGTIRELVDQLRSAVE